MKILFFISVILVNFLYAQTGGIKGKVTDDSSPIPLVNIIIIDTPYGIGTDTNGEYLIKNIPAGNYSIQFSAVGWETKTKDVSIISNRIIELDIVLREKAVEVGGETGCFGGQLDLIIKRTPKWRKFE